MRETHDNEGRRLPAETARLVHLRDRLDPMRTYTYRMTPKQRVIDLNIKAISLKDAAGQGRITLDELAADR